MRAALASVFGLVILAGAAIGAVVMMRAQEIGPPKALVGASVAQVAVPESPRAVRTPSGALAPSAPAPAAVDPDTTGSIAKTAALANHPRAAAPGAAMECRNDPSLLGVSRVVQIDTTGGPGFGFEQFKTYDFLNPNEVVLTFDDGPWPNNTPAVLRALAAQCTKATFFSIGKHAIWHPEILKQVAEQGHTIGSHTWSHVDLSKKTIAEAEDEIERGISAVHAALGTDFAPFFRFPQLSNPPEVVAYLGQRNIGIFSTDIDSFDFKLKNPDKIIQSVMAKLKKRGKGIILMHDFQRATAQAMPALLAELKAGGYRIVQLTPKEPIKTIPEYDAMMSKELGGAAASARPTASVVRTISE